MRLSWPSGRWSSWSISTTPARHRLQRPPSSRWRAGCVPWRRRSCCMRTQTAPGARSQQRDPRRAPAAGALLRLSERVQRNVQRGAGRRHCQPRASLLRSPAPLPENHAGRRRLEEFDERSCLSGGGALGGRRGVPDRGAQRTSGTIAAPRSGSACLNSKPRLLSGLRAVCQRCGVVQGGGRRLRRRHAAVGNSGRTSDLHLTRPASMPAGRRSTPRRA